MSELRHRVTYALDESRILITGSQFLIGFELRAMLEKSFERLSASARDLQIGALGLTSAGLALLMAPAAYHRIVMHGVDSEELHRFVSRVTELALLVFVIVLGVETYIVGEKVGGVKIAAAAGILATGSAAGLWFGWRFTRRATRARRARSKTKDAAAHGDSNSGGRTSLHDKIDQALIETRVVLPGTQMLLGFQFLCVFSETFESLPESSKYLHLASLVLVVLSAILLMTPAAYHRLVEGGEETERFHRFASRLLLMAMVPLALGLAGDTFVVVRQVSGSERLAVWLAASVLALYYALWFGLPLSRRRARERS